MKKLFTALLAISIATVALAQNYPIGHVTKDYIDGARSNRTIQTEVYFPATAAGDSSATVQCVAGQFPTLVFGHGFVMAWDRYDYLWKYFVAKGYVCVFPRTEGNALSTSHPNFGADLRYLADLFGTKLNTRPGLFTGRLTTKVAMMGHSMGGGSTFLGAKNNTQIATTVTFAAAQTNPTSTGAAKNVNVPTLIIAGGADCVSPPATNQKLMYDSTAAPIKWYLELKQGTHCNFASQGSVCEFGQMGTCGTLPRTTQNTRVVNLIAPWLNYYLKGTCGEWQRFKDSVSANVANTNITKTSQGEPTIPTVSVAGSGSTLTATGANISTYAWSNAATTASTTVAGSGTYTVTVTNTATGCTASAAYIFVGAYNKQVFSNIELFPNPSHSAPTLQIATPQETDLQLIMTSIDGKILYQNNYTKQSSISLVLPTDALPEGVYFINVQTDAGKWTGRWVKVAQ